MREVPLWTPLYKEGHGYRSQTKIWVHGIWLQGPCLQPLCHFAPSYLKSLLSRYSPICLFWLKWLMKRNKKHSFFSHSSINKCNHFLLPENRSLRCVFCLKTFTKAVFWFICAFLLIDEKPCWARLSPCISHYLIVSESVIQHWSYSRNSACLLGKHNRPQD